jgi:hypothetical protein
MTRIVFLSFLLAGLLAQCVAVPRRPEPIPLPSETVLTPPSPHEVIPEPEPQQPLPQPEPYTHEVRWPGETLSHIALWYTGSQAGWQEISRANGGLNPRSITIGDRIVIPDELLKTRKAMPREHLLSAAAPKTAPKTEPLRTQRDSADEALFEPVELLSPPSASEETELYGPVELLKAPGRSEPPSGSR